MYISKEIFSNVINLPISSSEKMTLLVVGLLSSDKKWRYNQNAIYLSGCSERHFKRALSSLVKKGYLKKEKRGRYLFRVELSVLKKPINFMFLTPILQSNLDFKEKLFLIVVTRYIPHKYKACYVSKKKVCAIVRIGKNSYHKFMKSLKEKSILKRVKHSGRWYFECNIKQIYKHVNIEFSNTNQKSKHSKCQMQTAQMPDIGTQSAKPGDHNIYINKQSKMDSKELFVALTGNNHSVTAKKQEREGEIKGDNSKRKKEMVQEVIEFWKKHMAELYEEEDVSLIPVTAKNVGQLNYIIKFGGENAKHIFKYIVETWLDAMDYIEDAEGLEKTPGKPNIGFITEHLSYLQMYYYNMFTKKKPKKVIKPKPTPAMTDEEWEEYKKELQKEMEG